MSDYILKIVAGVLFSLWLIIVLPAWVGGILYADQLILLPPADMHALEWLAFFLGMYVPPIIAAVAVYRIAKAKRQNRNA